MEFTTQQPVQTTPTPSLTPQEAIDPKTLTPEQQLLSALNMSKEEFVMFMEAERNKKLLRDKSDLCKAEKRIRVKARRLVNAARKRARGT